MIRGSKVFYSWAKSEPVPCQLERLASYDYEKIRKANDLFFRPFLTCLGG